MKMMKAIKTISFKRKKDRPKDVQLIFRSLMQQEIKQNIQKFMGKTLKTGSFEGESPQCF